MEWFAALGSILVLNLVLSGDNAVVIALACKNLPKANRLKGMVIGCAGAVVLRAVLTVFATELLSVPYVEFIGGLALFVIAIRLLKQDSGQTKLKASGSLWEAVKTIIIADFIMSLDNILSIAGVASTSGDEKWSLIICGLALSLPIVICGAQVFLLIMERFPIVVYLGSGILAYTAAEMMLLDGAIGPHIDVLKGWLEAILVIFVFAWGFMKNKRKSAAK